MRKTAHRFPDSATSIPVAEPELLACVWLLDGQIRQLSKTTLAARGFLVAARYFTDAALTNWSAGHPEVAVGAGQRV